MASFYAPFSARLRLIHFKSDDFLSLLSSEFATVVADCCLICHDAFLYLCEEKIDVIEPQERTDERSRLRNLSSLTILAYIKTKFEDLM